MKNPHKGDTLDSFLEKEDILAECTEGAIKKVIAWEQIDTKKTRQYFSDQLDNNVTEQKLR
jgi:antitoxin HicB